MKDVSVLTSGGMDSAVLLGEALKAGSTVHPLYIRCGLAWEKAELHWLRRFLAAVESPRLKPLTVLELPARDLYGAHWSLTGRRVPGYRSKDETVYLPGRNLLFLSLAAVFCARRGIPALHVGTLAGNPFPDATPGFFRSLEDVSARALGKRVLFRAPFRALRKDQVVARGKGLPLHLAFSCLSPRGLRPCGRCNKCAERDKVLKGV